MMDVGWGLCSEVTHFHQPLFIFMQSCPEEDRIIPWAMKSPGHFFSNSQCKRLGVSARQRQKTWSVTGIYL